jgi:predicted TIM-barrel fold metal-dependent hydrolase
MPYPPHYPLPRATSEAHAAVRHRLGIARGVLTQPAAYGSHPAAMLAAIAASEGALRGVAVAPADIDPALLAQWRQAGIVGLRFTEYAAGRPRFAGSVGFDALARLAPVMRDLGLHAQLWAPADILAAQLPALLDLGLPLVLDHMGMPNVAEGQAEQSFQAICTMLRDHDLWVKLSVCRVGSAANGFIDVQPFQQALIASAPDRCLWGSDWPYVAMPVPPDAGALLDLFLGWIGDPALGQRILVANPARLYQFQGEV